jgi:hypothetical protein
MRIAWEESDPACEFERGIILSRGLGSYAVTSHDPGLDHGSMLATG